MRDLKGFLAAGYVLTDVQPFDLFPQTRHLECVITLRRENGSHTSQPA
jgi:23S rRNA (uracil1939-C5)-methyltransferase/tRNA (uracil-5-)-methyltransferase